MSYQIIDGNIVAKDNRGTTRRFVKQNVDIVIAECKAQGITNKYVIAGILATISKESGFVPQNENLNYSEERLKEKFGGYFKPGRANARDFAGQPEKIANYIYGNKIDKKTGELVPGRYGNVKPGDGWKYRGRGFNQITFQSNYKVYQDIIPGLLENPDLLNNVPDAAKAAVKFYVRRFTNKADLIREKYGKSPQDMSDWNEALLLIVNITGGLGDSKTSESVKNSYASAKKCHQFLIDYLEKNPEGTVLPPTNPFGVNNQEQEDFNNSQQSEDQQSDFSNNSDSDSVNGSGINITTLTQIFPPTIKPLDITIDLSGFTKSEDKKKFEKGLGFQPLVWYNGVKIDYKDVINFSIGHIGIVPKIDLTLIDNYSFFREDGFPLDDTKITIYLNSRSINLRSIHMDFKIYDFKDIGDGSYNITGICDIPRLYLRKFNSYGSKTSYETMKDVAKDLNIGFCSNVSSSNDRMRWINTGLKNLDFIQNIIKNSYISDDSFQHCYIDFYYNLCYVDISKELNRDNSNDKMINAYGYSDMESSRGNDDNLIPAILTNEKNAKDSVAFFGEYEIFNKSTRVSIEKAYRIITKYYDSVKKELLLFNLESQTSDGNKTIILKGKPSDREFFNENIQTIWVGKQDLYDEGDGNVHENYNYAIAQNRQNLDDLTKVSCKIILPNSNFNLYLFQKIFLAIYSIKPSPLNDKTFFKRFTGNWLITNISFIYDGEMKQEVTLIKRELELSLEESANTAPREKDINETSVSENVNELVPTGENSTNGDATFNITNSTDPKIFVGPNWKSFNIEDAMSRIELTTFKPKDIFKQSLRDTLSLIKNDSNITDIRQAAYLLATAYAEAGYSLQRWEADFLYKGAGIPYGPEGPPQKVLNYYRSTEGNKKNYYTLGTDSKGLPYFGRGLIQLTGKSNYETFGELIGVDLVKNGDLALIPINSYKIAVEFLKERTYKFVIANNLRSARISVNGGTKGLEKVNKAYEVWLSIFAEIKPAGTDSQSI